MDCRMFSSMIDDYLDDALPAEQRSLFLAHAEECKTCKSELEHAQNMLRALRESAVDAPDFIAPAFCKIRRQTGTRRRRVAAFAGIAAVLLISGMFLFENMNLYARKDLPMAQNECAGEYTSEDCALPAEQPEESGQEMKYRSASYSAFDADILVLEEEQAQKLLEFLDGQQIALEPAEGGSYLSIEGRREVLLPFFEQSDIAVDLGQYRALFLTGV